MSVQPVTLVNGPSERNGDAEQIWERPWSLEEMRRSSANWSLAADSGLFLFLQDFSQKMLSKTHEIEKQLDRLLRDTKATDCCLHTVFNDFLMLSNTQFIENRVYDEEVEEPVPKQDAPEKQIEQDKTREQKEAELIPKVQEAVNYGLRVLETAFEHLDIKAGNSDSEDEEATGRVEPILEPKDLYLDRPLPYLIGSQLFMEQDDVGLGDLSSEEMSIDSDRDSVIDSEEDKAGDQSDDDYDQDEAGQGSLKKKSSLISDEDEAGDDEDEDSDIFGESDKEDEEDRKHTSVAPTSFADELAARIKGNTVTSPQEQAPVVTSAPSSTKRKSKGKKEPKSVGEHRDSLFLPPSMENEDYSPFGSKSGIFSGGKGLFDDDDDENEGDLFSDTPRHLPEDSSNKVMTTTEETVPPKSIKKIPVGAVSIYPEKNLFGSARNSDSSESRESGVSSQSKPQVQSKSQEGVKTPSKGGLFDDDEDEDDFFSGSTFKKPTAGQEKAKEKKVVDLFGADEDDEDDEGDIFSRSSIAVSPGRSKKTEEEDAVRVPEKKLPAGAASMFGPGTSSLLQDALRKRAPISTEECQKPHENVSTSNDAKLPTRPPESTQAKSLFSDDEDTQIFSSPVTSQPKHETQTKPSKAQLLLFDDEEEEDLFASAPPKPKANQVKNGGSQKSSKTVSSALFSDDEDQWMSSKPSMDKVESKSGAQKASASTHSKLPAARVAGKTSLFYEDDDDDDLFAATKEPCQKKHQRASLLFEEEDEDDDKGSLFGFTPAVSNAAHSVKHPPALDNKAAAAPHQPSKEAAVERQSKENEQASTKPSSAVNLCSDVDGVLDDHSVVKHSDQSDGLPHKEEPPKTKKNILSLFDEEDEEEENENVSVVTHSKPGPNNTLKTLEQHSRNTSTRVFQDEELLFSQKLQRDNDPDVDLFATSGKTATPKPSSGKTAATVLFAEDDEDDLFSAPLPSAQKPSQDGGDRLAHKDTVPPAKDHQKAALPVKSKEPSSRIGKLQVNLAIDPSSLLPGATPRTHHPEQTPTTSLLAAPKTLGTGSAAQTGGEQAVSFDIPPQVTTLHSANKGRAKGAERRRPQTRAARHHAALLSDSHQSLTPTLQTVPQAISKISKPILPDPAHRAESTEGAAGLTKDFFAPDNLFATTSKVTTEPKHMDRTPKPAPQKEPISSISQEHGDSNEGDLFQPVKQKSAKKASSISFLDEEDDDIFAVGKSTSVDIKKEVKPQASPAQQDIFQDAVERKKTSRKQTERAVDQPSLFDDDVDIFADLTVPSAPKEKKSKKKVEKKSIFDDDMDDIFSSGPVKSVANQSKSKKSPQSQESPSGQESSHSLFDDPLNALGGN